MDGFLTSGQLALEIYANGSNRLLPGAEVTVFNESGTEVISEMTTDEVGQVPTIELEAPPLSYSMEPSAAIPYSRYRVEVRVRGFQSQILIGIEIFAGQLAFQPIYMNAGNEETEETIVIPPNNLYEPEEGKIAEPEVTPPPEDGEIVLSRVVVPEYIIVHDGVPSDTSARNYYVKYRDYIKNVASSEIYSTWPDAAIRANVLAIMSFTLNRVYTEIYRSRGYDFTITSNTAYDQKWTYGRTIYESISRVVDEMYGNYLSRPGVKQPILTQYCDGRSVTCPNWLSQWGSKSLADQGLRTIQILRYYYGSSLYINTADEITGLASSYPGELAQGSRGDKVRQLQQQINRIADNFPAIPKVNADGIYGPLTAAAVQSFQSVFGLPATGVTDYRTWYKISQIYVGVTGIG